YSGQWAEGKINGEGTLYLLDGTSVAGYWENGVYVGEKEKEEPTVLAEAEPKARSVKVWAVIIGVASYNHMPTLRYTDDDAYRMFAFLKSPEGGALPDRQIKLLIDEDATKERIVNAMRDVFAKAGPNDLVFLYYSGHGLKGSFLPIDFDGFNNRLEHQEINEILDESPAKYKLCIADACHSGSLLAMKSGSVKNVLESYYETLAQAEAGTALIMSSKSEETSLESSGLRQGVFSHFLIRGLKGEADEDKNKVVTIGELYNFLNNNVRKYTGNRQSPVIQGDYDQNMTVSVVRDE
ncbi:MAG: caspase family protein, partial [Phaeodactylibacter sp.]|nr:caspase family protein [Phaeodactylibacter sp.]